MTKTANDPHIGVLSGLFPSSVQPNAGLFMPERLGPVARRFPLAVVAPTPWFPLQSAIRLLRPHFRPGAPAYEVRDGIEVWYPRFLSPPGILKRCDGRMMALAALPRLRALQRAGRLDLIDAHFGYPDGYAATLLGRWLRVPVTITLHGLEERLVADAALAPRLRAALTGAARVFAVSEPLRQTAIRLGVPETKVEVVGNGVNIGRFQPRDRAAARTTLGLSATAPVLVSVGGLVERKGFHRVIEVLPELRRRWPDLVY